MTIWYTFIRHGVIPVFFSSIKCFLWISILVYASEWYKSLFRDTWFIVLVIADKFNPQVPWRQFWAQRKSSMWYENIIELWIQSTFFLTDLNFFYLHLVRLWWVFNLIFCLYLRQSASFEIFDKFLRPEDREIYFRFVFATFLSHYGLAGSITAQFL